jgi:hypothetical protein
VLKINLIKTRNLLNLEVLEIKATFVRCTSLLFELTSLDVTSPSEVVAKLTDVQSQLNQYYRLYRIQAVASDGNFDIYSNLVKINGFDVVVGELHGFAFFTLMWAKDHFTDLAERDKFVREQGLYTQSTDKLIQVLAKMDEIELALS